MTKKQNTPWLVDGMQYLLYYIYLGSEQPRICSLWQQSTRNMHSYVQTITYPKQTRNHLKKKNRKKKPKKQRPRHFRYPQTTPPLPPQFTKSILTTPLGQIIDRSSILTWRSRSIRADIFLICERSSSCCREGVASSARSGTCSMGWICTMQIMHNRSQRQIGDELDDLDPRCEKMGAATSQRVVTYLEPCPTFAV